MWLDKVGALMAQKVHDLVFVSTGTPGLDLTWSPSERVMMIYESWLAIWQHQRGKPSAVEMIVRW